MIVSNLRVATETFMSFTSPLSRRYSSAIQFLTAVPGLHHILYGKVFDLFNHVQFAQTINLSLFIQRFKFHRMFAVNITD